MDLSVDITKLDSTQVGLCVDVVVVVFIVFSGHVDLSISTRLGVGVDVVVVVMWTSVLTPLCWTVSR